MFQTSSPQSEQRHFDASADPEKLKVQNKESRLTILIVDVIDQKFLMAGAFWSLFILFSAGNDCKIISVTGAKELQSELPTSHFLASLLVLP